MALAVGIAVGALIAAAAGLLALAGLADLALDDGDWIFQ